MKGNPKQMFDQMYASNPQFKEFADSMKGKSPQEAFKEYGMDYDQIKNMM